MRGSFDITREIDIDASPETVCRFFTEPALLERWLCVQAEVDARPGGGYVFNVTEATQPAEPSWSWSRRAGWSTRGCSITSSHRFRPRWR